jgi:hypothetical protein
MIDVIKLSLQVTGFVLVMMLVIEYLHVRTQGFWEHRLQMHRWGQYLLAAVLGASPGCLGAFAVVALYTHRRVSLGALVTTMLATAGDESFVMFAMIPRQALVVHAALLLLGIVAGIATDVIVGKRFDKYLAACEGLTLHADHQEIAVSDATPWWQYWRRCSMSRGVLAIGLTGLLFGVIIGEIGPPMWNWLRITIVLAIGIALWIVITVSEHFLEEHLWQHVVVRHIPRVFAWTLGSLLVLHLLTTHLNVTPFVRQGVWVMLGVACLIGIIPESGPHLIFVTLFAQGLVPLSVLLASSIVQDGHGMLPLLAHSRRAFLVVKAINMLVAVLVGGMMILYGR